MPSSLKNRLTFAVCVLILGLVIGYIYGDQHQTATSKTYSEIREKSPAYKFTNPLLLCDSGEEYISGSKAYPSKSALQKIIDREKSVGHVNYVSLYFRDLNNGPWLGINMGTKFFPASLMKVPLMFYFYKKAESDPKILAAKVNGKDVPQTISFDQYFQSEESVSATSTYTVDELINHMIKYSDNRAANDLLSVMDPSGIDDVLQDLYIEIPSNVTDDYITVRDYSSFFRVLFNASYLNQEDSEKALKLLSETTFDGGLKKYLPKDIVVSHKFGERELDTSLGMTDEKQLHDCGIVYYPKQPYLLCVMTRGDNEDIDNMANVIGLLSKAVYDSIDSK